MIKRDSKFPNLTISVLFIFLTLFCSCSKKQLTNLTSSTILKIPINNQLYNLNFPKSDDLYYSISEQFGVLGKKIIISEIQNNAIKIFHRKKLQIIIYNNYKTNRYSQYDENSLDFDSQLKDSLNKKFKLRKNTFLEIPGKIVAGKKNTFFIVNHLENLSFPLYKNDIINKSIVTNQNSREKIKSLKKKPNNGISYYNILQFDTKGNLLQVIERKKEEQSLFENIIWIDVDKTEKLWVLHSQNKNLTLNSYKKGESFFHLEQKECLSILYPKKNKKFIYTCLGMYPFFEKENVILIGKIEKKPNAKNKLNLWDREIFEEYTVKIINQNLNEEKMILSNVKNIHSIPYLPFGKDNFLVLNSKKKNSYRLFNTDGVFLKTINLNLKEQYISPHSIFTLLSGKVYGAFIKNQFLYFQEWN